MIRTPGERDDVAFQQLLSAAVTGAETAWAEIYRWLAPQVLGFLRGRGATDPEDILGEVFVEIARRIHRFEGDRRGFRAWVFTITRAQLVDDIRRRVRRREHPVGIHLPSHWGHSEGHEDEVVALLGLEEILGVLGQLTEDQREVLLLRTVGEMTAPEAAMVSCRSVAATEQLYHRALKNLRRILAEA
jgi:RNA polymerase sigma factor (sigma-70 family)